MQLEVVFEEEIAAHAVVIFIARNLVSEYMIL